MQACPKCSSTNASMSGKITDHGDMVLCTNCGTTWERLDEKLFASRAEFRRAITNVNRTKNN